MNLKDPVVMEFCQGHGESDAETLIIRLCTELLAECPTERGPSPLDVLSSIRNIRACRSGHIPHDSGCSGLLIPKNGGYEIIVNSNEPEERQWFSFAHEIVHTFFREVRPNVSAPSAQEETLCDIGAAELTMPRSRFGNIVKQQLLRMELFDQLHEEFRVSFDAAGRRALSLTEEAACLFFASLARSTNQDLMDIGKPILRFVSWSPSTNWPDKRSYKNLPLKNEGIIAESFFSLENRTGIDKLGSPSNSKMYEIETRAYEYRRRKAKLHRQVVALAKV